MRQSLTPVFLLLLLVLAHRSFGQRFAAIGDYGSASSAEKDVARLVHSWRPDFIITLGDNNYDYGEAGTIDVNIGQYYHDYIGNYKGKYGAGAPENRFFPSLGNHDTYTAEGRPYLDYFTLPGQERYYDFVRGNVHFFVLNSNASEPDGILSTSRQAQWLQQGLAASTAPWKVVYLHHPPFSSGEHGSSLDLQWPFCVWGASVVLAGHDHLYERIMVNGLAYFVNGLGGKSIYSLQKPVPGSQVRYNDDYGAMLCTATSDSLVLRFVTRAGQVIDTYSLQQPALQTGSLARTPAGLLVLPNPVAETAAIEVRVPVAAETTLRVLDTTGREVAVLHQGPLAPGTHRMRWPRGRLAPGLYFLQLTNGCYTQTVRAVVL
ncbi:metallophosphoesterase family protein [Hymenobacter chitinivorans]|uniref:Putative secreted protein (Por secretion system target) n=1 Tax=Hymenobacter chitinivorans DSM 11115 TaxID=1121954 RepID=A0A2M9AR03_9BACT|nr:metallophosphoesterase [Hymenobacter chitinivorans]PJJ48134.1 putative secreted protein (Por secretion system target) [Hymenobacter chitinivorans DSM 11115]